MNENRSSKKKILSFTNQSICLIIGFLMILPIVYALIVSFMQPNEILSSPPSFFPSELYTENYKVAWGTSMIPRFLLNSLFVSTICAIVRVITASFAAYAFSFYEFKGRNILFMLIIGTMLIPLDTVIATNYQTVSKMGLLNSYLGIMILYFISASNVFLLRQSFLTVSKSLKEAAAIDGCSDIRFFFDHMIHISKPVLSTVFISSFISTWNMYLWPLIITTRTEMRTIQVGITMLNFAEETAYGATMAGAVIVLIPSIIIFVLNQRSIVSGMTSGAIKG